MDTLNLETANEELLLNMSIGLYTKMRLLEMSGNSNTTKYDRMCATYCLIINKYLEVKTRAAFKRS
jgi:hypothetical protein